MLQGNVRGVPPTMATKKDIADLKAHMKMVENRLSDRLTVRMGAMIGAGVAGLAAMKFFS